MMRTEIGSARHSRAWRIAMWSAIAGLLVLPWAAMRLTGEIAWTAADFAAAAIILIGAGAIYDGAIRRIRRGPRRWAAGAVLFATVAVIWVQGAAGIV